ncbi:ATP-binding protein [Siminovitchia fortis]|uniref:histidine kinase n=1 Tax=Siminovitchia fortis TaxID=254758 RepID=A0A443IZM7_9BACI|nr:PAS domain-containing sensor histidine kinase [Siminovitchia fortis]RWR13651.1 sensor histidine kinase [Siminovitchia fortis]WHY81885.1 ATP-binding protein [Siminovitchia fortis]
MTIFQSKLTKRYVTTVLVVILFVLSVLYIIVFNVMNNSVQSQMEYRDELFAKTLGAHMESVFQNVISDMRQISSIVETLDSDDTMIYQKEIETIISQDPLYLFVEVYKENEKSLRIPDIAFSGRIPISSTLERLSWSKTRYISNIITLPDGRKTVIVSYPTVSDDGEYLGSVIAYLNLNNLSDLLEKFGIGEGGINAMVDRNGAIIAHENKNYIGKSIKNHEVALYLKRERFGVWRGPIFNEEMVVSYRPLFLGEVGLIVGEPIKQAMAPAQSITQLLIKGFIIVFIIAVGLAIISAFKVVRPIKVLIKQAKDYKEDKQKVFHTVKTNDEIEELSIVLSEMAASLRKKEKNLHNILESIPYAIITTDIEGKITTFNTGAEKLMHYNRNEVVGKNITELPINNVSNLIILKTLQQGSAIEEIESHVIDKDRKVRDIRLYASLFTGEEHEDIRSIIVIRDVSELKKLEDYLKQSERLASLGQLTAGIAHEIKNPLSIIQASTEALRLELEDILQDKLVVHQLTDDILITTDRMNNILTDFLHLTKNGSEKRKNMIDLIGVTDELLNLLRKKMNDQNVILNVDYKVNRALVLGDRNGLIQVLLNVILNSLQAMETGGTINILLEDNDGHWQLSVSDTGEGISPTNIKWIFNPLYSTKNEGTGLGLSIAHEIIVQHNGRIWAESTLDEGTTIYITLPKVK